MSLGLCMFLNVYVFVCNDLLFTCVTQGFLAEYVAFARLFADVQWSLLHFRAFSFKNCRQKNKRTKKTIRTMENSFFSTHNTKKGNENKRNKHPGFQPARKLTTLGFVKLPKYVQKTCHKSMHWTSLSSLKCTSGNLPPWPLGLTQRLKYLTARPLTSLPLRAIYL